MIKITYQGVDISADVSINRCRHDMWAARRSDTLKIYFNDAAKLWDGWAPQVGDEIRADYNTVSTGTMFVRAIVPENGLLCLHAMSVPPSAMAVTYKAWSKVRLTQVGQEIAARHGLKFKAYDVPGDLCDYVLQAESDCAFLHRRAVLEGCAFLVYDKTLILYNAAAMERAAPTENLIVPIDGEYRYMDARSRLYGSCIVEHGEYRGQFAANNGASRVLYPKGINNLGSDAEAVRFAKGLLRDANCNGMTGYVKVPQILSGYAAASTVNLSNTRAPSWDGPVFLHHVSNEYAKNESKIFFRKPLEGY